MEKERPSRSPVRANQTVVTGCLWALAPPCEDPAEGPSLGGVSRIENDERPQACATRPPESKRTSWAVAAFRGARNAPFAAHEMQRLSRQAFHLRLCWGIRPHRVSRRTKRTFCDTRNADKLGASKLVATQKQSSRAHKASDQPNRPKSRRFHIDRPGVAVSSVAGGAPPLDSQATPMQSAASAGSRRRPGDHDRVGAGWF